MVSVVFQPHVKLDLISEIKNTNFVVMSTVKRTWSIEGEKWALKFFIWEDVMAVVLMTTFSALKQDLAQHCRIFLPSE